MKKNIRLFASIIVLLGLSLYNLVSNLLFKKSILIILILICITVSLEYIFNKKKYTYLNKNLLIFLKIIPLVVAFFITWLFLLLNAT
ncbi:hypothetical protein BK757_33385 [Bacillus thuringiensis serovar aizawai]|uniref:Uncharacterized protein n=1 Tax=Bacillus thuringiensis TaxID=1428 RepID=A0A9X6KWW2_BACTU|nr:hypothetical protein C623_0224515 [Bacillus thuringiensis serovar aizawai str. Hu4-2]OIX14454.1 hypothetical protein BMT18_31575 [Bacillus thuringiensis serovar aizawai]OUA33032.1 hypothetical protein BK775_00165 [Bacillus thuringiensis]OTY95048.1 hypothetical protein BK755_00250 [Bacillus thuringiensis serovar aizawai]OTZ05231.1 hypothetical protein BK757_33385 [Bacillus thuringiensis serovar aizawai]